MIMLGLSSAFVCSLYSAYQDQHSPRDADGVSLIIPAAAPASTCSVNTLYIPCKYPVYTLYIPCIYPVHCAIDFVHTNMCQQRLARSRTIESTKGVRLTQQTCEETPVHDLLWVQHLSWLVVKAREMGVRPTNPAVAAAATICKLTRRQAVSKAPPLLTGSVKLSSLCSALHSA